MKLLMTANQDTWLKEDWRRQASNLPEDDKEFIKKGTRLEFISLTETSLNQEEELLNGHALVILKEQLEELYLFGKHWDFPWDEETPPVEGKLPEWNEVNWNNFKDPISKYFTVGEVCLYQTARIPTTDSVKQAAVKYARNMDEVREWLGCGILLTSWYRPMSVEKQIGGSGANHPYGLASDWYPAVGNIYDVQARFEKEWYNTGRWTGGFGRGANKGGFIHTDHNARRMWNY